MLKLKEKTKRNFFNFLNYAGLIICLGIGLTVLVTIIIGMTNAHPTGLTWVSFIVIPLTLLVIYMISYLIKKSRDFNKKLR